MCTIANTRRPQQTLLMDQVIYPSQPGLGVTILQNLTS